MHQWVKPLRRTCWTPSFLVQFMSELLCAACESSLLFTEDAVLVLLNQKPSQSAVAVHSLVRSSWNENQHLHVLDRLSSPGRWRGESCPPMRSHGGWSLS